MCRAIFRPHIPTPDIESWKRKKGDLVAYA